MKMTTNIAINGFGRIGRVTFRTINQYHRDSLAVVAANGSSDAKTNAHLLKWDTAYGKYPGNVEAEEEYIIVDGNKVRFFSERDPAKIPWHECGVDIVIDSTGTLTNAHLLTGHIANGAKKVIISAPATNEDITIVLGVNEELYDPEKHHIVSCASCTTNCVAPVVKVLHENFIVNHGLMTTVHSYTRDQRLIDRHHTSLRRARSAPANIIPTTTGAAKLVGRLIPELEGKIDGLAMRVPVPSCSVVDLVAELEKKVTVKEVNNALREAAEGKLQGILGYTEEELVSSDFLGTTESAIVDAPGTMIINDNMVKVLVWYDNEWAFCCRLAEVARLFAEKGL